MAVRAVGLSLQLPPEVPACGKADVKCCTLAYNYKGLADHASTQTPIIRSKLTFLLVTHSFGLFFFFFFFLKNREMLVPKKTRVAVYAYLFKGKYVLLKSFN